MRRSCDLLTFRSSRGTVPDVAQRLGQRLSYGGQADGTGNRWYWPSARHPATRPARGVVVHTSEQAEDANDADDAEQLCAALARPGTSGGPGAYYGAGYHDVSDIDPEGWWEIAPPTARTNSAPPLNGTWLHICIPERVALTRAQWLGPKRGHLRVVAAYIVTAARGHGFPPVRVTAAGLKAGARGYCGHHDVTLAFGQTTHTDPDPNFPWDVLAADIAALIAPPPIPIPPPIQGDDEMTPEVWSTTNQIRNLFVVSLNPPKSYGFKTNDTYAAAVKAGWPHRSDVPEDLFNIADSGRHPTIAV